MYNEKPIIDELAALKKEFIANEEKPEQKYRLSLQSLMYLLVHLKKRVDEQYKSYSLDTLSILLAELSETPLTPSDVWFDKMQKVNVLHVFARMPYDCSSLLNQVEEIFKDYYDELLLSKDNFGFTPLNAACKDKNIPAALEFIRMGRRLLTADNFNLMLTTENHDGFTPLNSAYETPVLVATLINNVEDSMRAKYISKENHRGYTAFHNACRYGVNESVLILLSYGSRWDVVDEQDESNSLQSACWAGKDEIVRLFLDEIQKHIRLQQDLEKYKQCVLAQTNKGDNALHKAAFCKHKDVISTLFNIATTLDGTTYSPTLHTLITQKDVQGNTPLDIIYKNLRNRVKDGHDIYDKALEYLAKYCTKDYITLTHDIFRDCSQNNIPAFTSLIYHGKNHLSPDVFRAWVTKDNGEIIDVPDESRTRIARYLRELEPRDNSKKCAYTHLKFLSASVHSRNEASIGRETSDSSRWHSCK
jgi:ankyrin repeat protein